MPLPRLRPPSALLGAAAGLALAVAACHAQESPADIAFGKRVRAYLLAHPEVLQEAFEKLQANDQAAKLVSAKAAIASRRDQLERDPRDPVLGNPKGKITVVEFFDYRCPFCKAAEPSLQKLLADNPDVRLVLKEFPILDVEDQSHISEDASRAALAAHAQGKYRAVHDALLAQKRLDEAGIAAIMASAGVDPAKAKAVETSKATAAQIADAHALAQAIGVDGTPAFVVGDQMIAGAQMDALRAAVEAARKR